jgi:hypothetical protein
MEDEGFKPSAEDLRRWRKIKNGRRRILSFQPKKDEGRKSKMKAKVVNLHSPLLLRALTGGSGPDLRVTGGVGSVSSQQTGCDTCSAGYVTLRT